MADQKTEAIIAMEKLHFDTMLRLYEVAVSEYQLMVKQQWTRTTFFLGNVLLHLPVFAIAVLAATSLEQCPPTMMRAIGAVVALLYALFALLGFHSLGIGHLYYRHARDHMTGIAKQIGTNVGLKTTETLNSGTRTKIRITTVTRAALLAFAVADISIAYMCLLVECR